MDLKNKTVTIDNGADTLSYEKIILAPGGIPRKLPVEGADLENVFTFRDIADAEKVDAGWWHTVVLISFCDLKLKAVSFSCQRRQAGCIHRQLFHKYGVSHGTPQEEACID